MTLRRLLGAAAFALAVAAPVHANPLAANTFGGGTVSGAVPCGTATAAGTVANTVLTGYVGAFSLRGTCSGSTVTMSATGTAVTGSTLRCPKLVGHFTTDGATTQVDVTGECRINNFPTKVRWHIDSAAGAGAFTVQRV